MKNFTRLLMASFVLITSFTSSAHAGLGILGGANFYNTQNSDTKATAGLMVGLRFEQQRRPGVHLELDAMYVKNNLGNGTLAVVQVPLLARFHLLSVFDLGVGPYVSYIVDEVSSGTNKTDLGAVGSLRLHLPLGSIHLTLEGRYLYGFTNLAGSDSQTRGAQALAGLHFGL